MKILYGIMLPYSPQLCQMVKEMSFFTLKISIVRIGYLAMRHESLMILSSAQFSSWNMNAINQNISWNIFQSVLGLKKSRTLSFPFNEKLKTKTPHSVLCLDQNPMDEQKGVKEEEFESKKKGQTDDKGSRVRILGFCHQSQTCLFTGVLYTDSTKINRQGYNIRMYWTNL